MLKTVKHVENYVEISRCVENVYVRHVENHVENHVEVRKKHHHTLLCVLKLSGRFHFSSLILHTFLGSYIHVQIDFERKLSEILDNTEFGIKIAKRDFQTFPAQVCFLRFHTHK